MNPRLDTARPRYRPTTSAPLWPPEVNSLSVFSRPIRSIPPMRARLRNTLTLAFQVIQCFACRAWSINTFTESNTSLHRSDLTGPGEPRLTQFVDELHRQSQIGTASMASCASSSIKCLGGTRMNFNAPETSTQGRVGLVRFIVETSLYGSSELLAICLMSQCEYRTG